MDGKISNFSQVASLRRYTLTDGREKGLDIIDCDNGKLRFLLNVTKALDIAQLYHNGQNVSFISKNGFSSSSADFIHRFEGGMLYTCGLDSVGGRDGSELHGSYHNTPATVTRVECNESGITVEAEIASTALFGKNLVLKRKIFSAINSDKLVISDTLENRGYSPQEYCLLYHVNIGYPMFDENVKILADEVACTPRNDWAKENVAKRYKITAPIPNQDETCYFLKLNKPEVTLLNEKLGKCFTISYSKETLPHFVLWKSMASGDYALGFEPSTTELDDRFKYSKLREGKKVSFNLTLCIS